MSVRNHMHTVPPLYATPPDIHPPPLNSIFRRGWNDYQRKRNAQKTNGTILTHGKQGELRDGAGTGPDKGICKQWLQPFGGNFREAFWRALRTRVLLHDCFGVQNSSDRAHPERLETQTWENVVVSVFCCFSLGPREQKTQTSGGECLEEL